ncbi:MAG: hydroxymethylbilane synthase [Chloroflexota bacterium]|nr:hydroxymethylbilane synthase [Chloroflexota bacterium]
MNGPEIAIGSRGSALALAQARLVHEALRREGYTSRVVIIETDGDRRAPDTAWGEGAFVAAIGRALLDGAVDVAVHSAKDVPTDQDPRLLIAAYLPRADPRDALVVRIDAKERRLADLPLGCRVGTDSPRRTGFLLARRPDLIVHSLHGNVDTRLGRLDAGETDALVLACAGLDRMGRGDRIVERLEPEIVPPAPGQGAIAVQVRSDDERMVALAAGIDHRPTRLAVEAERAFLSTSGGGCRAPIGALATVVGDELDLLGGYASPDGARTAIARRHGPLVSGEDLARELAAELDVDARIRAAARFVGPTGGRSSDRRVLVTRAADQAAELLSALRDAGLDPIPVPAIAIEFEPPRGDLDTAVGLLHTYRWVVITSTNGARAIFKAAERILTELGAPSWAAIGPATSRVLEHEGISVQFQPSQGSGMAMAVELPIVGGDRILVVRGDLADEELAVALRARGAEVDDVIAYRTREAPESSHGLLRSATANGPIAAVAFTSGSTVRGLMSLAKAESIDVRSFPAVCIGPETADEARSAGFRILAVAPTPDATAFAAAAATALARQPGETP